MNPCLRWSAAATSGHPVVAPSGARIQTPLPTLQENFA